LIGAGLDDRDDMKGLAIATIASGAPRTVIERLLQRSLPGTTALARAFSGSLEAGLATRVPPVRPGPAGDAFVRERLVPDEFRALEEADLRLARAETRKNTRAIDRKSPEKGRLLTRCRDSVRAARRALKRAQKELGAKAHLIETPDADGGGDRSLQPRKGRVRHRRRARLSLP
jgi:hypothetical protein